jgi:flagellar biosynthesis protein FlhB
LLGIEWEESDDDSDFLSVEKKPSLFVNVTKILLMITIVLSVTMVIINGILYITKSGSGEDPKSVIHNLLYIAIGIIVALFSVIIVTLFRSVGETTLKEI